MTREEAIERIKNDIELNHNCLANEYITALNMAIEALSENKRTDKRTETHACDCISRQAAIDVLKRIAGVGNRAIGRINELPSVSRPTGHWIDTQVDSAGLAHRRVCSICGEEPAAWSSVNKFDFCPNCGARMESEEE